MAYVGQPLGLANRIQYTFYSLEGQSLFTGVDVNGLTLTYDKDLADVYLNGNLLVKNADYIANNGSSIQILGKTLRKDDVLVVNAVGGFNLSNSYTRDETDTKYHAKANVLSGFRNKIINGNFDIWQRGTSQSGSGYGSADRWYYSVNLTTQSISRQSFTIGQTDVPGNPEFYSRVVISGGSGADSYAVQQHRIEGVETFSNKTVTVTFWAKANSSKSISTSFEQYFGTGGSSSSVVVGIEPRKFVVTTSWQKFTYTANIPSVSGKTLGSNNNDFIDISFWFSAGSNYDSQTNSLGIQSGTFDIARVSIVEGDATSEADPFSPRHIGQELFLCQRYYWISNGSIYGATYAGSNAIVNISHPAPMRTAPTTTSTCLTTPSSTYPNVYTTSLVATGVTYNAATLFTADAEL